MKKIRRNFERFCYANANKGIPNLMLYLVIGNAMVYLFTLVSQNPFLYSLLVFDRTLILRGQLWRLISYPLSFIASNPLLMVIALLCYYSLGRAIEQTWGTLKFNLFYLTGIVLSDIFAMIFNCSASVFYLNMSLLLSFATLYPQSSFLLFFIIPIKAWVFALVDLAIILIGVFSLPLRISNLFPLVSLANYFLFFGKDVANLFPLSWRLNFQRKFGKKQTHPAPKVIIFNPAERASSQRSAPTYTHRCTVCGRTDVSDPQLEFRYCSKCQGYYCYCSDHINNHTHIQ